MTDKILFVDDEVNILDSMRRQLRKRFQVVCAQSGREALEKCKTEGPFSVIVSDMRMPEMDGIELLTNIKALYPDTVRLMLTGNADQETAIEAVNKGQIFRFLNKPCPMTVLAPSLALAIRQYRLITAEKELLAKTLKGSIKVLSELLNFTSPIAFSSGLRIRPMVMQLGPKLGIDNLWQLEMAALLSQIGCVTLPPDLVNKIYTNSPLDDDEREMYHNHPVVGADMLANIPRLEGVAAIIHNQLKEYQEYDSDNDGDEDEDVRMSSQLLRAALDYNALTFQGIEHKNAIRMMTERENRYNPDILHQFKGYQAVVDTEEVVNIMIKDLAVGMVVEEEIYSKKDMLLAPKGQEITLPVLQGLKNFAHKIGVREPIRVRL